MAWGTRWNCEENAATMWRINGTNSNNIYMVNILNYDKKDTVIETAYRDNQNRRLLVINSAKRHFRDAVNH